MHFPRAPGCVQLQRKGTSFNAPYQYRLRSRPGRNAAGIRRLVLIVAKTLCGLLSNKLPINKTAWLFYGTRLTTMFMWWKFSGVKSMPLQFVIFTFTASGAFCARPASRSMQWLFPTPPSARSSLRSTFLPTYRADRRQDRRPRGWRLRPSLPIHGRVLRHRLHLRHDSLQARRGQFEKINAAAEEK